MVAITRKKLRSPSAGTILLGIALAAGLVLIIYPLFWMLINSFKTLPQLMRNSMGLPQELHWENYAKAWDQGLAQYFFSSIVVSAASVLGITLLSAMVAYGLTRFEFKGRNLLFLAVLSGLTLSPYSAIVPLFKLLQQLHLYDTYWGVILPYIGFRIPFTVFLMRSYFIGIPRDLEESARIDGCGSWRIFLQIIIPISRPILASSIIVNLIYVWNEFLCAMIFLEDRSRLTIPVGLNNFRGEFLDEWHVMLAGVVIACIPTIALFLVLQKQFVRGLTAGSVKG